MAVSFSLESSLLEPVRRHLYSNGVRKLSNEVQFYDYRLDVYGYSSKTDATYAVELKLRKWQRALEQALIYQLCADYVLLALPATNIASVDVSLLKKYGIGLIAVQSEKRCVRVLEPRQSPAIYSTYKDFYVKLVQGEK